MVAQRGLLLLVLIRRPGFGRCDWQTSQWLCTHLGPHCPCKVWGL
jgi:hypothetical protein